jgi:hypothetical protein
MPGVIFTQPRQQLAAVEIFRLRIDGDRVEPALAQVRLDIGEAEVGQNAGPLLHHSDLPTIDAGVVIPHQGDFHGMPIFLACLRMTRSGPSGQDQSSDKRLPLRCFQQICPRSFRRPFAILPAPL